MSLRTGQIQTVVETRRSERNHTCMYTKPFTPSLSTCACVAVAERASVGAMAKSGRVRPPSRFIAFLSLLMLLVLADPVVSSGSIRVSDLALMG